jgi:hypothetical protein
MALSIVSITHTTFSTDATSHLVDLPATVTVNDLLLIFFSSDANTAANTPSGWGVVTSSIQGSNIRATCYYKIATGSEGGTQVDCTTASAEQAAAQVYRIQGNLELGGAGFIEGVSQNNANVGVTTFDPPAVTASWGADNNLFISYVASSTSGTMVSGPSGWGTVTKTNEGSANSTNSAQVFTSVLASSSATGDPGVWTLSATGIAVAFSTIVIRPKIGGVGLPVNTVAGALVSSSTQGLSIPAVATGRILLITSHCRRASTTLAPDNPSLSDTSGAPLTWTPVFSTPPSQVGQNPGTKAQWWWAVADGNSKSVTLTWTNGAIIYSSVADFAIIGNPDFTNQITGSNAGTGTAVTVTLPTAPSTGINFLSFYGAGGSASTIPTGWTSLTFVSSTPYRTGYDITPVGNTGATMGGSFPGQQLLAVNIVEGGSISVNVTGQSATVSVGTVTVTAIQDASNLQVTGFSISCGTLGYPVLDYITVRTSFANPLGGTMARNQGTVINPFTSIVYQATVQVGDLVYVLVTERSDLTVTGITDNIGNTYTPVNSGSDIGTITGRAFYSIVTNPGTIFTVSAAMTPSNNDCIMMAQAFQGPFAAIDANPANVGTDITSPYDGPASGTLAQADELLVAWATRTDSTAINGVSPLVNLSQVSTGSAMRTRLSMLRTSSTTSFAPQFTSASDPIALLSGTTTFSPPVSVSVNVTTNSATVSVGNETVNAAAPTTQTVAITDTANDGYAWWIDGNAPEWDDTYMDQAEDGTYHERIGVRFPGVHIPSGSLVTTAILTFTSWGANTTCGFLLGVDHDNYPAWDDTNNPEDAPKTTARVRLIANFAADETPDYNVAAIVNEIVSRSGWTYGNTLAFASGGPFLGGDQPGYIQFYDYNDGSPSDAARLYLEWQAAAPNVANPFGQEIYAQVGTVYVKTIFVGLTAGATPGVVGSGGSLPTGWGHNKSADVTLTVVAGPPAVDGVECFDFKMDTNGAGNSSNSVLSIYFPLGFGGTTPAAVGESWKAEAYIGVVTSGGSPGLVGNALSIHESNSSYTYLGTHDDYTTIGYATPDFLDDYRSITATLTAPTVARLNGAIYIQQDYTTPSSYTFRIAAQLTKVGNNASVSVTGQSVTASVGNETVNAVVNVNVTTNLMTAFVGTVSVTAIQNVQAFVLSNINTLMTAVVGTVSVTTTVGVTVNLTTNLITASVGGVSVSAGGAVSVNVTGNQIAASVGTVTVVIPKSVTLTTTTALTASVGNENVAIGITINVTGTQITASVGTVIAGGAASVTVFLFGEQVVADSSFGAVAAISTTAIVTGQSMTVSRGTVIASLPKVVTVTGQSVTVSTKVPTFILNHFITVHAPVMTVYIGQAVSPNWGTMGPGEPAEAWTNVSGSSKVWTPVPGSTSTPNNWT